MTKKGKKVVSKKNRDKGPSKVSQVECFNYRGRGSVAADCPYA